MNEKIFEKGKVKFLTLGCRLNQYETQAARENFLEHGYGEVEDGEKADVFVINTCTVTSDSDKTSRYLIRKCKRENPNAKIIVTGCYVERDSKIVAAIPGVTHIVLNRHKADMVNLLESCTGLTLDEAPFRSKAEFTPLQISEFSGRTRAHIKIQDGCNHACSFCKVVLVRGKSRSRELLDIAEEAKRLSENGYPEIVLTGVQLGAYGLDLPVKENLSRTIQLLSKTPSLKRIRLSSIEPVDVTDELIETLKHEPKACHHLHIPLQSGSDEILKTMNRRYDAKDYLHLVQKLNRELTDFILTLDVMVGFPGETERYFEETVETIMEVKPYKLHIFPYSPRAGTHAFSLEPVSREISERRMTVLAELEKKLRHEIHLKYVGRTIRVLIEESKERDWQVGRADNYLEVKIPRNPRYHAGDFLDVDIQQIHDDHLIGIETQT